MGSGSVDLFIGGVPDTTPIRKLSAQRRRTVHVRQWIVFHQAFPDFVGQRLFRVFKVLPNLILLTDELFLRTLCSAPIGFIHSYQLRFPLAI